MDLYTCSQTTNSDFLFEAQNKFILYNVCDNYVLFNMTEEFLTTFHSNGIVLTLVILLVMSFLLKVLDLITSRFILSDLIFTKKYFKLREVMVAVLICIPLFGMNLIMPKKQDYSSIQIRSSKSILNIILFCLGIPMSLFNYLRHRKGIIFPKRVFNLTLGVIFISNIFLDFYLGYTNRIDYVAIVFLILIFVFYTAGFFILLKMDNSEQRNLAKTEGYKITHQYVILEFELEELGSEGKQLNSSENPDTLAESEIMSDSMGASNSLTGSKLVTSQNFAVDSEIQASNNTTAAQQLLIMNKDSLEDFMEIYELELEEKIREFQKKSVQDEFGEKLFFNEDEQREILRNKKITLWDKVFAEFCGFQEKSKGEELFDKIFVLFFALSIPSLMNPLMKTKFMPVIINNCILMTLFAMDFLFHFKLSNFWLLPISILVATILFLFNHFKVYNYTIHRYICNVLTIILGYVLIFDVCFILTDFFVFFVFYFKVENFLVMGATRSVRYVLPAFYIIAQLCKAQRSMIAVLFSFLFVIGCYTLLTARAFYSAVVNQMTKYSGFVQTLALYNKKAIPLLQLAPYFIYFYIILMSFLMVIKKYKFDMSLMIMSTLLFGFFVYSVVI